MAYKISEEECTSCGICMDLCPVEAISAGDDFYIINPDICPVNAIHPVWLEVFILSDYKDSTSDPDHLKEAFRTT